MSAYSADNRKSKGLRVLLCEKMFEGDNRRHVVASITVCREVDPSSVSIPREVIEYAKIFGRAIHVLDEGRYLAVEVWKS